MGIGRLYRAAEITARRRMAGGLGQTRKKPAADRRELESSYIF
ncbi:protein of unknown function [Kyrpidia spormannii]|uniref:Uncharacterized protein n=1 Tax=Kyrpidia spormannii TaxID=2055160 RepID=A0A6F9E2X3_9BACL|nr:protein of unknown function [Kyrpidia spormannii]